MDTFQREKCEPRVHELEIKITFLERRLEEQEAAMLEHFRQLERLQREMRRLTKFCSSMAEVQDASGSRLLENEKPPHY